MQSSPENASLSISNSALVRIPSSRNSANFLRPAVGLSINAAKTCIRVQRMATVPDTQRASLSFIVTQCRVQRKQCSTGIALYHWSSKNCACLRTDAVFTYASRSPN